MPTTTVSAWPVLIFVFLLLAGIGAFIFFAVNQANSHAQATSTAVAARVATQVAEAEASVSTSVAAALVPTATPEPTPAFAEVTLRFGEKGSGRSQFEEARWLALDNAGHVFVYDGANHRVQVFSEAGEYLTQWLSPEATRPQRIAADRQQRLYILDGLSLTRYEGLTGEVSADWAFRPPQPFAYFFAMALTPQQGLLVSYWDGNRDHILTLDAQGSVTAAWNNPMTNHLENDSLAKALAMDLQGYVYAFENAAILKFSPEGRFLNRIGAQGSAPGEWTSPQNIAVDGEGWLYVGGGNKIIIYDANGRYVETIITEGNVMDVALSDNNDLWAIIDFVRVVRYRLNR